MDKYEQMSALVKGLEDDFKKFYLKGNHAAGTRVRKAMQDLGYKNEDVAAYKSGNVPLTEKQKSSSIDVMNTIAELVQIDWNDTTGLFAGFDSIA